MGILETVEKAWDSDCKIDKSQLDEESRKVPELHNKYYKIFRRENNNYRKLLQEKQKCHSLLYDYYSGNYNTNSDMLARLGGRSPITKKYTKETIERYIQSDDLYTQVISELAEQEELVEFLQVILKQIGTRQFHIRDCLEFLRFSKGDY